MAPTTKRKVLDQDDDEEQRTTRHKVQRSTVALGTPPSTGRRTQKTVPTSSTTSKAFTLRNNLTSFSPTLRKVAKPTTTLTTHTPKSSRKTRIASDPINISIYELRKEGLDWNDIAISANHDCNLDSDHELSGPACYSRFKRNGPLVAEAKGEPFQKEWYMHMNGKVSFAVAEEDEETEVEDEMEGDLVDDGKMLEVEIVKTVEHERAQFWVNVTEVVNAKIDSRALSEDEVKAVYDRIKGGDI